MLETPLANLLAGMKWYSPANGVGKWCCGLAFRSFSQLDHLMTKQSVLPPALGQRASQVSDSKQQLESIREPVDGNCAFYPGNCLEVMDAIAAAHPEGWFDMIFADPPYFLSNGGITCHAGKMVKVDKGDWDKSGGAKSNHEFNIAWLSRCQSVLRQNGTIWVSGTSHVIFSVGYAMQELGFKILNDITWEKPNPPPNLSCRYFTHATETVLWAAKGRKSKHIFNYKAMRELAGGKQMKSVWRMSAPSKGEKLLGKHPTQKPVALIERCVLASTNLGDKVLDPFMGSGTTAVACLNTKRDFEGIELDSKYLDLAKRRVLAARTEGMDLFSVTV